MAVQVIYNRQMIAVLRSPAQTPRDTIWMWGLSLNAGRITGFERDGDDLTIVSTGAPLGQRIIVTLEGARDPDTTAAFTQGQIQMHAENRARLSRPS